MGLPALDLLKNQVLTCGIFLFGVIFTPEIAQFQLGDLNLFSSSNFTLLEILGQALVRRSQQNLTCTLLCHLYPLNKSIFRLIQ